MRKTWVNIQPTNTAKNFLIALKNLDAIKTTLIRAIQKIAEVTGDLIGSKIADEITGASKKKNL